MTECQVPVRRNVTGRGDSYPTDEPRWCIHRKVRRDECESPQFPEQLRSPLRGRHSQEGFSKFSLTSATAAARVSGSVSATTLLASTRRGQAALQQQPRRHTPSQGQAPGRPFSPAQWRPRDQSALPAAMARGPAQAYQEGNRACRPEAAIPNDTLLSARLRRQEERKTGAPETSHKQRDLQQVQGLLAGAASAAGQGWREDTPLDPGA